MNERNNRNHLTGKWLGGVLLGITAFFIVSWVYMIQANVNGLEEKQIDNSARVIRIETQTAGLTEDIKELKDSQKRIEEKLDKVLRISNVLSR